MRDEREISKAHKIFTSTKSHWFVRLGVGGAARKNVRFTNNKKYSFISAIYSMVMHLLLIYWCFSFMSPTSTNYYEPKTKFLFLRPGKMKTQDDKTKVKKCTASETYNKEAK